MRAAGSSCQLAPSARSLQARLDLDGLYVGYDKIFDTAVCHTFQGFLKAAGAGGRRLACTPSLHTAGPPAWV